MSEQLILWVSSGYGANTREPFVTIHWKDVVVQLSLSKARGFALSVELTPKASIKDFARALAKKQNIAVTMHKV
jgi:hypothetical protein